MAQRVKGQETELTLSIDGVDQESMALVKDMELEFEIDNPEQGYLGETANRVDAVFKGVSGSANLHFESAGPFDVLRRILDKASRQTPDTLFTFLTTIRFSDGTTRRITLPDVSFGNVTLKTSGREDYSEISLSWKCTNPAIG
jgi:hypothetical protein